MSYKIEINEDMIDTIVVEQLAASRQQFLNDLGANNNVFVWNDPEEDDKEIQKHIDAIDMVLDLNNNSPKVSKRFEQLPIIRRFAIDPEARGTVTAYYELKNATDSIVRTSNLLERTMNFEERGEFLRDNIKMLASKEYILDLEKTMKEFRQMQVMIRSSNMDADAKREALLRINQAQNALTANIQTLKANLS